MINRDTHAKLQDLYEATKNDAERLAKEAKELDEKLKRTEAQLRLWKGTGL